MEPSLSQSKGFIDSQVRKLTVTRDIIPRIKLTVSMMPLLFGRMMTRLSVE